MQGRCACARAWSWRRLEDLSPPFRLEDLSPPFRSADLPPSFRSVDLSPPFRFTCCFLRSSLLFFAVTSVRPSSPANVPLNRPASICRRSLPELSVLVRESNRPASMVILL